MSDKPVAPIPAEARGDAPGRGRMNGRRVLVVGGGQNNFGLDDPPMGNGRAMSLLLAREGASVCVADIDAAAGEATAELVRAEGGEVSVAVANAADEQGSADSPDGASPNRVVTEPTQSSGRSGSVGTVRNPAMRPAPR